MYKKYSFKLFPDGYYDGWLAKEFDTKLLKQFPVAGSSLTPKCLVSYCSPSRIDNNTISVISMTPFIAHLKYHIWQL